jgi:hypothetical protein
VLRALRDGGPHNVDQLAAQLSASGRRPFRPATIAGALAELHTAGLATVDVDDQDVTAAHWSAAPVARDPLLEGHEATGRNSQRGSAMGAHYRHTTSEMAGRVAEAVQQRLTIVLQRAEQTLEGHPLQVDLRIY